MHSDESMEIQNCVQLWIYAPSSVGMEQVLEVNRFETERYGGGRTWTDMRNWTLDNSDRSKNKLINLNLNNRNQRILLMELFWNEGDAIRYKK